MDEDITPELIKNLNFIMLSTHNRKLEVAFIYDPTDIKNKYIELDSEKRTKLINMINSTNEYNEFCTGTNLYFIKKSIKIGKITTDSWFVYLHFGQDLLISIDFNYLFLPRQHLEETINILSPNIQYFKYLFSIFPNFGENVKIDFLESIILAIKRSYIDFRIKLINDDYTALLLGFMGADDFKCLLGDCKDKLIEKARDVIADDINTFLTLLDVNAEERLLLELKIKE